MEESSVCIYCSEPEDKILYPCLKCMECEGLVHVKCLHKRDNVSRIAGDVFFIFYCAFCGSDGKEKIHRDQMPWFLVVTLALYDMNNSSFGLSNRGYFHWRTHLAAFIDKHWLHLFTRKVRRRKNWVGTIAGSLSHHSPAFFTSGATELGESGWWKLAHPFSPEIYIQIYNRVLEMKTERQKKGTKFESDSILVNRAIKELADGNTDPIHDVGVVPFIPQLEMKSTESINIGDVASISGTCPKRQVMTTIPKLQKIQLIVEEAPKPKTSYEPHSKKSKLCIEVLPSLQNCPIVLDERKPCVEPTEKITDLASVIGGSLSVADMFSGDYKSFSAHNELLDNRNLLLDNLEDDNDDFFDDTSSNDNRRSPNSIKLEVEDYVVNLSDSANDNAECSLNARDEDNSLKINDYPYKRLPTLFVRSEKHEDPWKANYRKPNDEDTEGVQLMAEYNEKKLHDRLSDILKGVDSCKMPEDRLQRERIAEARRLYRKLSVRKYKKENNMEVFDIDRITAELAEKATGTACQAKRDIHILDRFQLQHLSSCANLEEDLIDRSFATRLTGQCLPSCFVSPFTGRTLKPYIRRDYETRPLWLQVMEELQMKVTGKCSERAPLDYSYVRPQHISSLNSLSQHFFWPGIDLTEVLQYPDFSVVVLYKKLVVGFGLLVPDVSYTEAYISFLFTRPHWQKSGIGTFMLYHLVQTCMGKDLLLHVSVTNPAILLYQKFGFKIEEFIQDFYDKYMPVNSRQSKHALLLRLTR